MSHDMKWLLRYLVQGAIVAVPIVVTLYITSFVVTTVDGFLPLPIPGLGLIVTLGLLVLIGFLASSVVGTRVIAEIEKSMQSVPLIKILYNAIKDLIGAFVGNKRSFNRPVAVRLPGSEMFMFGFATREALQVPGFEGHIAVYFPQSYNFAGNVLVVPRAQVQSLEVRSSEAMTFIVSGGVSGNLAIGRSDAERPSMEPTPPAA
jgi:uncharacterized membrane protein